jgi:hypothetical protein
VNGYTEFTDSKGRAQRLMVESWMRSRIGMYKAFREMDLGAVTLCMSKHDIRRACGDARRLNYTGVR